MTTYYTRKVALVENHRDRTNSFLNIWATINSIKKIRMKRILLYIILFACFIRIPICAQVGFAEYKAMFDIVKDSLDINQAYVSDSLREHRLLGLYLHQLNIRDSIPLYGPDYVEPNAEYSELLHSGFDVIEDIVAPMSPCCNAIYFSFPNDSYICVYAYLCVNPVRRKDLFPHPVWGTYHRWFTFIFQIREESVVFIDCSEVHGL